MVGITTYPIQFVLILSISMYPVLGAQQACTPLTCLSNSVYIRLNELKEGFQKIITDQDKIIQNQTEVIADQINIIENHNETINGLRAQLLSQVKDELQMSLFLFFIILM